MERLKKLVLIAGLLLGALVVMNASDAQAGHGGHYSGYFSSYRCAPSYSYRPSYCYQPSYGYQPTCYDYAPTYQYCAPTYQYGAPTLFYGGLGCYGW